MAITAEFLSGAANGLGVKVAATATAGTLIHTAPATPTKDEIYLWAYNSDTVERELTIEWGGVTAPDNHVKVTIPPKSGDVLVIDGKRLSNSLVVRAFCAAAANVIIITGYVNRIA